MKKILIVYSSLTGNTKAVADAITEVCPTKPDVFAIQDAPAGAEAYALVIIGYWVNKGLPDAMTLEYMKTLKNKNVAFFGTLGAYPDSEHAKNCMQSAEDRLKEGGNEILGHFMCQGKVDPKLLEMMTTKMADVHPMTPERQARIEEAKKHPNQDDFARAQKVFSDIFMRF